MSLLTQEASSEPAKRIISLSHLRGSSATRAPATSDADNSELETFSKSEVQGRVINLSHLKRSVGPLIVLNNPDDFNLETSGNEDDDQDDSNDDETSADVVQRIRPNSSFLKRFVGGVERSNCRLPIVSLQSTDALAGNIPEDKEQIIAELRAQAAAGGGGQHKKGKKGQEKATNKAKGSSKGILHQQCYQQDDSSTDTAGLSALQRQGVLEIRRLADKYRLKVIISSLDQAGECGGNICSETDVKSSTSQLPPPPTNDTVSDSTPCGSAAFPGGGHLMGANLQIRKGKAPVAKKETSAVFAASTQGATGDVGCASVLATALAAAATATSHERASASKAPAYTRPRMISLNGSTAPASTPPCVATCVPPAAVQEVATVTAAESKAVAGRPVPEPGDPFVGNRTISLKPGAAIVSSSVPTAVITTAVMGSTCRDTPTTANSTRKIISLAGISNSSSNKRGGDSVSACRYENKGDGLRIGSETRDQNTKRICTGLRGGNGSGNGGNSASGGVTVTKSSGNSGGDMTKEACGNRGLFHRALRLIDTGGSSAAAGEGGTNCSTSGNHHLRKKSSTSMKRIG